jgi:hypothetical protein
MGQQQAAVGPDQLGTAEGRGDLRPQLQRAPAQLHHLGLGLLPLRQRAQHAGRREAGSTRLGRPRSRIDDLHAMPGPRQLPGQQPAHDAGACDGDVQHQACGWMGM